MKNPDTHSNIVSFITGWAGVISTASLGFLAVFQNRIYNIDNGKFLQKLKEIQEDLIKENQLQNQRLYKIQKEKQRIKTIENILSDMAFFMTDINLLNFIQSYENYDREELYLKALSIELKMEMLRRRVRSYSIVMYNDNLKKEVEVGKSEKEQIERTIYNVEKIFTDAIALYSNEKIPLADSLTKNKKTLIEKCFNLNSKYNLYLEQLKE